MVFEGFAVPIAALTLDPEQADRSEDGNLEPAGLSARMELAAGEALDTPPDSRSELSRSVSSGCWQETLTPDSPLNSRFSAQPSPLNEALDLMRSLAIMEGSLPNYTKPKLGAESREFCVPPTTHFIATVKDLTDMLDYASEDIDGMDDDARDEQGQNPPFTG